MEQKQEGGMAERKWYSVDGCNGQRSTRRNNLNYIFLPRLPLVSTAPASGGLSIVMEHPFLSLCAFFIYIHERLAYNKWPL